MTLNSMRACMPWSIGVLLLIMPLTASAESVMWNGVYPGALYIPPPPTFQPVLNAPSMSVQYHAGAFDTATQQNVCGATILVGTQVTFKFDPHTRADVVWNGTGFYIGTPYGFWVASGGDPFPGAGLHMGSGNNICTADNYYGRTNYDQYATFSVAPPNKSVSTGSGFSCNAPQADGSVTCTATTPSSNQNVFNFAPTIGHFWWAYNDEGRHLGYPACMAYKNLLETPSLVFTQAIPQQSIICPITVVDTDGSRPAKPILSAGACTVGTSHTISMTSTDPDNNQIRYGVDWDGNGIIDQFVPPFGYVPSGTTQTASRTYSTAGTKTVKVLAQDNTGLTSLWATISFSCNDMGTGTTATTTDLNGDSGTTDDNSGSGGIPSDLSIRAIPSAVRSGKTTQINWSASGVDSCTVSAPNGDFWDTIFSVLGGNTSKPITKQTVYTLSCKHGLETLTKTTTVKIVPIEHEL